MSLKYARLLFLIHMFPVICYNYVAGIHNITSLTCSNEMGPSSVSEQGRNREGQNWAEGSAKRESEICRGGRMRQVAWKQTRET